MAESKTFRKNKLAEDALRASIKSSGTFTLTLAISCTFTSMPA